MRPSEPLDLLEQRRVSHDLRWASRTWVGSPYFVRGLQKSPKEILIAVLSSQHVNDVIHNQAAKGNGKDEEEVKKQAEDILSELGHDFHMYAIRWFGLVLSKLGKRLYKSIQVNVEKVNRIKKAYGSYPVLLLPTHRSYVDFLLVSYMSFCFDLTLPVIAAGMDFKGMVGVGEILRKSGAFYIRRRFGGDPLYWALIREYVKRVVMEGGHPLEMFVEGTRSRSGKPLMPKTGLLSIVAELVISGQVPDILILPISMSYDRTLEEGLYAHELLGKPKPKESTNGLMKALKWLGDQSYGSVYVHLGDLISMREMLESSSTLISSSTPHTALIGVQEIALKVVLDQQANLVVPLFAGVSLVILSKISRGSITIPLKWLIQSLQFLQRLLITRNSRFGLPLLCGSLEANIMYILGVHSSLVRLQSRGLEESCVVIVEPGDVVQHMVFQHYANQILPSIFPLALITLLQKCSSLPRTRHPHESNLSNEFKEDYIFLRELFQEDFLFEAGTLSQELEWATRIVESAELLGKDESQIHTLVTCTTPAAGADAVALWNSTSPFVILSLALQPYVLAYWGVAEKLREISDANVERAVELKELGKQCQDFLLEKMKSGVVIEAYGALSLETLTNAMSSLVKLSVLERVKLENGSLGLVIPDARRLSPISSRLDGLVSAEQGIGRRRGKSAEGEWNCCDPSEEQSRLRAKL